MRRTTAKAVAAELVKYITKDQTKADAHDPESCDLMVSAEVFGLVYELYAGHRRSQSSRGFIGMGDAPAECPDCHATRVDVDVGTGTVHARALRVRIVDHPPGVIHSADATA